MSNRFFPNAGHMYSNSFVPRMVTLQFQVDSTNGAGISNLKSNGFVRSVYMHSASPSSSNPNPANGLIQIQMQDNYTKMLNIESSIQSPLSGSDLSVRASDAALTVGQVYTISVLGGASAANWLALGVPSGVTPAVGVSFIALVTGAGTDTVSKVQASSVSSIASIEQINNPSLMLPSAPASQGEYIFLQCLAPSASSSALTFTGSALAVHNHDLTVIGGQAASTTNDIAAYAGPILGKEQASNATFIGANSATNGGVVGASAGTPAGSINTPSITMSMALKAPANNSIISLSFLINDSSATVDGL